MSTSFASISDEPLPAGIVTDDLIPLESEPAYQVTPAATSTFQVTYNGFKPQAQAAFQYAVDIWESLVKSPVTIEVEANWIPLSPGFLGQAKSVKTYRNFPGAPVPSTWYPVALANSLAGKDLDPSLPDITANFNTNTDWYFGTDGNTPDGKDNFVQAVLHELAHGLGFGGSMYYEGGQGAWGSFEGANDLTVDPWIFDRFIENGAGQSLIDTSLFPNLSTALGTQLTSSDIFFDGLKANTVDGGQPKLYAPTSGAGPESIISHLDEFTYNGTINALMTPFDLGNAEGKQQLGPITFGIFQDMGWAMNTEGWIYGTPGNNSLTGTAADQNIYGLEGNDILEGLAGNDFLDGGTGEDTLKAGPGNDTYVIDSRLDIVTESANAGTDTVKSSVTWILGDNLEQLILSGTSAIYGAGNSLNNTIIGNAADNILRGGAGKDTLNGRAGIDVLSGNNGNDILVGGAGNDQLNGGAGNDRLTGDAGNDQFVFDNAKPAFATADMGVDTIIDFSADFDKILLDKPTFTSLNSAPGDGFSMAGEFKTVGSDAAAATSSGEIVYSRATDHLFYNPNGAAAGFGTGALFATLTGISSLAATDFIIIQ